MPDSIDGVGAAIVCTFDNEPLPLDLGDAPDTYGTTLASYGPRHGVPGYDPDNGTAPSATVQETIEATGNTAWQIYTGEYVVPDGQFITRFEFEAVASATGNPAAGNFLDAIQFGVECPTDFGDAPASYGTLLLDDGARHQISSYDDGTNTAGLMLGASIDKELEGQPGVGADGDDVDDIADEDGVATPIVISMADPTPVTVSVVNTTGEAATLAGWVDLNGDGDFDDAERVIVPVTASGDYALDFPVPTTTDLTYARFRFFPGAVADPRPTGLATAGEVEDYPVEISGFEVVKSADPSSGTDVSVGDTVAYTITLNNLGTVDLNDVVVSDDLTGVLDDADLVSGPTVVPDGAGTATVSGDVLSFAGGLPAGGQVTITYAVSVDDPSDTLGDGLLQNAVTSPEAANCPDPAVTDPTAPEFDPDCVTTHPVRDLEVVKASDPADGGTVAPGDTVTYTVIVTNTGGYDYTAADPAEVSDDLSGVIDDAFYNNDADEWWSPGDDRLHRTMGDQLA